MKPELSESIFHAALCNGLAYTLSGYGLSLGYSKAEYAAAKEVIKSQNPNETVCYEDVLLQILKSGGTLTLIDEEGEGKYNSTITLQSVHDLVPQTPLRSLANYEDENDDAEDADAVLQTVFYEEIIFG
jgi:hypothetical protein